MNSSTKILFTIGSFMLVLASVEAACYIQYGCKDADTNKTRAVGSSWTDSQCTTCSCDGEYVATCLEREIIPMFRTYKKFGGKRIRPSFKIKTVDVVLKKPFVECPTFTFSTKDLHLNYRYKVVNYYKDITMSCCTVPYFTQAPPECEAVLNKKTCQTELFNKGTKDECTAEGPISMVGK